MAASLTEDNLLVQNIYPLEHREGKALLHVRTHQIHLQLTSHLICSMVVEVLLGDGVAEFIVPDDRDIAVFRDVIGKKLNDVNGTSASPTADPRLSKTSYFEIMQDKQ
jgi:hypothetical protein